MRKLQQDLSKWTLIWSHHKKVTQEPERGPSSLFNLPILLPFLQSLGEPGSREGPPYGHTDQGEIEDGPRTEGVQKSKPFICVQGCQAPGVVLIYLPGPPKMNLSFRAETQTEVLKSTWLHGLISAHRQPRCLRTPGQCTYLQVSLTQEGQI